MRRRTKEIRKRDKQSRKKWTEFIVLSLCVHFILFFLFGKKLGLFDAEYIDPNSPVEVYMQEQERQIVNIDDDNKEELNKTARYFSKSNRRVSEETKASQWGKPKNVAQSEKIQKILKKDMDNAIKKYIKNQRESQNKVSTTYDYLPEVKKGSQTILNTAEFIFYSFYRRVEETIVPFWNGYVNEYVATHPDVRKTLRNKNYITEVQVFLDAEGNFKSIMVLKSSGVVGLDDAAGRAFVQAAPFYNPPRGMIDSDGLVTMKWRFVVSMVESMRYDINYIDDPRLRDRRFPDPMHQRNF